MKALILVGGYGTRLRPLTLTVPKPLVHFANKPMLLHQIEALVKAGVDHIVLAVNYKPEAMVECLYKVEKELNIKISFSVEQEPLGTGGPLALAKEMLDDGEPFFVLNSDVICEFPFEQVKEFHKKHGCQVTICATKVEDPSKYGVICHLENDSLITNFVEKPSTYVGNKINAGIYMLSPKILDRIKLQPTSIEHDVFPIIAKDKQAHVFELEGFWMDVGQPKDFLTGTCLYLSSLSRTSPQKLVKKEGIEYGIKGNVLIDPSSKISKNCLIGPNVTIGKNVVVKEGVRLQRCVIMDNAVINENANVTSSIIGWNSKVGRWARLENVTVLGDDVTIKDEVYVNGATVLPHKSISQNIPEPQIIM